jgi:hypothetical protein
LRIWSTVGAHAENGLFAIYGARLGTWMTNCSDWNYVDVRDFELLRQLYNDCIIHLEQDENNLIVSIKELGDKIKLELGLDWPDFTPQQSKYMLDLYDETINLGLTYYKQ